MSLYPNYAQPSTSSGYYAQQHQQPQYTSHQQYQYPPPTQPDPYTMTSDAFRHWFMGQLAHVVVNQKNIIHHIAFIAKEHATRMGPTIAQCIEQHIRRVSFVTHFLHHTPYLPSPLGKPSGQAAPLVFARLYFKEHRSPVHASLHPFHCILISRILLCSRPLNPFQDGRDARHLAHRGSRRT